MTRKNVPSPDTFDFFEYIYKQASENCIIIMDEGGVILGINQAFTFRFHYSEEELTGKFANILYTPEDQEKMLFEREVANVNMLGVSTDDNYLVDKNNTITWVSGESVLVKNSDGESFIVKIIQSIHEQKTLEKFLVSTNSFVESILRCIKDSLVVINSDFVILKANQAFCDVFCPGGPVESLYFFDMDEAFASDKDLKQKLQDAVTHHTCFSDLEMEIQCRDGKTRNFKLSTNIIDEHAGEDKRILLVMQDVTTEKMISQQRDDLIGFVSHELRNPLANIMLCTNLLEDSVAEVNQEETRDYLARIQSNINRLNKIITELHDATKAGSGQLQIEKQLFCFEKMADESIETIQSLYPEYSIIRTGNADITVHADRYRLAQVLTNYLSNAVKYSEQSRKVWVHLKVDAGNVVTEVKDEGSGIAEDQVPFIFTRYFRAAKTMRVEGLGLGLYLSGEIIKAHNGRVWLNSKEGQGSSFYFSVPVE